MNRSAQSRSWSARLKDGPLDRDFWLGEVDARLIGVFRAGLGAILFCDVIITFPLIGVLYGEDGIWPSRLAVGPLAGAPQTVLYSVYVLGAAALLSFTLGIYARVSAALGWLFLAFVHQRNLGVTTGGDFLAQILLFFCVWMNTGAALSVPSRWLGKSQDFLPAAPFRMMQVHLAILYFVTARLKIRGGWLSGDGIYLGLQHLGFVRPPGAFLLEHPDLCRALTFIVLGLEGAFPFLALLPIYGKRARLGAMLCGLGVQLGILTTMRVGMFTPLMLWTCVLFFPVATRPAPGSGGLLWRRRAVAAICAVVVVLLCWGAFVGRRFPLPRVVSKSLAQLGLVQPFDLFGATYEVAQWSATGTTAAGTKLDLLTSFAPGFRSEVDWSFSPLYKATFASNADHAAIAQWLCREAERGGQPVSQIVLSKRAHQPARPRQAPIVRDVTLYSGTCERAESSVSKGGRR